MAKIAHPQDIETFKRIMSLDYIRTNKLSNPHKFLNANRGLNQLHNRTFQSFIRQIDTLRRIIIKWKEDETKENFSLILHHSLIKNSLLFPYNLVRRKFPKPEEMDKTRRTIKRILKETKTIRS